ncbi:MAG: tetratricopeptide repeat protein, partial [Bacteroidetes bacterium]|nr:tetratricopeptide repeat protein [Bacteroidota bacterium]
MSKLFYFLLITSFWSSVSFAQDAATPIDTSEVSAKYVQSGNHKCDSAEVYLKKKENKISKRFYADAIKDYAKAIKLNPSSYPAYYFYGIAATKTKDYGNAILSFDQALIIDPEKGEAFRERGKAQAGLGKDSLALKDYNRAIDKNYDDYESYYLRAML